MASLLLISCTCLPHNAVSGQHVSPPLSHTHRSSFFFFFKILICYTLVWSYGPNWPAGGEVDIIEGANDQYGNVISGHTTPGCTVSNNLQSKFSGVLRSTNCDVGTDNVGCGYSSPADDTSAYGDGFNAANGGVYAMEWDDEYIKIWHFARSQIPSDIDNKEPDPSGWGLPDAIFGGDSCDVDNFFKDMSLVINIVSFAQLSYTNWEIRQRERQRY